MLTFVYRNVQPRLRTIRDFVCECSVARCILRAHPTDEVPEPEAHDEGDD